MMEYFSVVKNILVLICTINLALTANAQVLGRFYYNRYWQLTKKDSVYYFRVAPFDTISYTFAGEVRDFTKAGKLVMKGTYQNKRKNGEFTFYYPSGQIESVGNFNDDIRSGTWKYFYSDGKIKQEVEFTDRLAKILYYNDAAGQPLMVNGTGFWSEEYEERNLPLKVINKGEFKNYMKHGEWTCQLEDGKILYTERFSKGEFIKAIFFKANGKKTVNYLGPSRNTLLPHYKFDVTEQLSIIDGVSKADYPFLKKIMPQEGEIFSVIEISAKPEGGMQAFYKAVGEAIQYPPEARRRGIEGRVFVEFVINSDGSLSDFKIVKGIGAGCDDEAIRTIKESNKKCKWIPGSREGSPVRQRYTLPIIFKLG